MFAKSSQILVGLLCAAAAVNASPYEAQEKRDCEHTHVDLWRKAWLIGFPMTVSSVWSSITSDIGSVATEATSAGTAQSILGSHTSG